MIYRLIHDDPMEAGAAIRQSKLAGVAKFLPASAVSRGSIRPSLTAIPNVMQACPEPRWLSARHS
jgi:hypothetical protein